MASYKTQPQPRRPYSSSPPSPKIQLNLSRANSDFYAAPTFEENKRKSSSLLPSPTTLEVKPLPEDPFGARFHESVRNGSNPASPIITTGKPTVALTMASPVQPEPSRQSLTLSRTDAEGDVFMDGRDAAFDQSHQPFKVNPLNIPARPASRGNNLTELEQRGLVALKQKLSSDKLSASRESSPVPSSISSEDSTRALINRIDELNAITGSLKMNLNDTVQDQQTLKTDHDRLLKAYEDVRRQNQELQAKMIKRERDYEVMSKNYLDHVRLIRATDDDHSTIIDRLTQLKASIEHLVRKAQGGRSVNLNRVAAIDHFKSTGLLADFPIDEDKLEPFHLNLFMESVIMSTLVSNFFGKPLCCIFDYNKGFQEIYDWMHKRNDKLAIRWRQQLCVMLTQDPETKIRQEAAVTATASSLTDLISRVYTGSNEGTKIKEMCSKSFDLAVAMTGLESVIAPVSTPLGVPFDEDTMAPSLKSNPTGKIALVIFPAFKDSEETFTIRPKVWCY
ncbi:hypothetical protein BC939DRAFT_532351 [Gamsiella multidivaricata]|uniref:uncharacterized protein n=1 Tax=Gamsiella multidivaricata TaxID=101098 RepID=UPI00221F1148|nr:uncharacterized protein BC939DRAFT_532351 [Gamsiella multidivaricata]KAG0358973.1 hypothetical protein BGZ54_010199 [Gamsiella multidivaricata]KAI7817978.1 hypothetical protein BC939DRAFT_532351 [Gamsiella multidivaricata]